MVAQDEYQSKVYTRPATLVIKESKETLRLFLVNQTSLFLFKNCFERTILHKEILPTLFSLDIYTHNHSFVILATILATIHLSTLSCFSN